jgi:hypothetical protein
MTGLVVLTLLNLLINFIILFVITDIIDEIKIMRMDNDIDNSYIIKEIHKLLMEVTRDENKKKELKEKINRDKWFSSMLKNFRNMNR